MPPTSKTCTSSTLSPDSVDPKWKSYFDGFKGREAGDIPHSAVIAHVAEAARNAANNGHAAAAPAAGDDERGRNVGRLITAYRSRGHLSANIDPLALTPPMNPPDLAPASTTCPSATWTASSAPVALPASRG